MIINNLTNQVEWQTDKEFIGIEEWKEVRYCCSRI